MEQFWNVTICGKTYINGQEVSASLALKKMAESLSKEEIEAFLVDCVEREDFEMAAILLEEKQKHEKDTGTKE